MAAAMTMGPAGEHLKGIDGPVFVDCKTRLVPSRLVRFQSVFDVYVYVYLSVYVPFGLLCFCELCFV